MARRRPDPSPVATGQLHRRLDGRGLPADYFRRNARLDDAPAIFGRMNRVPYPRNRAAKLSGESTHRRPSSSHGEAYLSPIVAANVPSAPLPFRLLSP